MRCEQCWTRYDGGTLCPRCQRQRADERLAFRAMLGTTLLGWREDGLIDLRTHQRLLGQVREEMEALCEPGRAPAPVLGGVAEPAPALDAGDEPVACSGAPTSAAPEPAPEAALAAPVETASEAALAAPGATALEPAPEPPPRPRLHPLPPPVEGAGSLAAIGSFLRSRTGWAAGVVLTVVGSFYAAGTVWGGLGTTTRHLLVVGFLALYALGFAHLGLRIGRHPGGQAAQRWLTGLAVALAPIHAMAAGGLLHHGGWQRTLVASTALLAVGLLHHYLLRLVGPRSIPGHGRALHWTYLALSLSVGLLPLVPGPGWLLVPGALTLLGLWAVLTRGRQGTGTAIALLGQALGFHLVLAPPGPVWSYAPLVALAGLAVLYVDAALGRWRTLHRVDLQGIRGVASLGLTLVALAMILPRMQPLPTGSESALTAGLAAVTLFGAALTWRRPGLLYGALGSLLLVTLSLPDLAAAIVDPLREQARQSLGYHREPLPLAWYSLTLVPFLVGTRLLEAGLLRTDWRQARTLARCAFRWTMGLAALLLVAAHTRLDDPRPVLCAIPVYSVLWLREARIRRALGGVLPWIGLMLWVVALSRWALPWDDARLALVTGTGLLMVPASRRLRDEVLGRGAWWTALVATAVAPWLAVGLRVPGRALLVWGLAWSVLSLVGRPSRLLDRVLAWTAPGLVLVGLVVVGLETGLGAAAWGWSLAGAVVATVGLASVAERQRPSEPVRAHALHAWAHLLFVAGVVVSFTLDDPHRALLKLPLGLAVLRWLFLTRSPVYGVVLVVGGLEGCLRQLGGWMDPPQLAAVAVAVAWLPAAFHVWVRRSPWWVRRAVVLPSWWLGLAALLIAVGGHLVWGVDHPVDLVSAAALVGATWLASRAITPRRGLMEALAWGVALVLSVAALDQTRVVVALLPVGLSLLERLRPALVRRWSWPVAAATAAGCGVLLGPAGPGLLLLVGSAAAVTVRATRGGGRWIEASLTSWVAVVLLVLEQRWHPGVDGALLALSACCLVVLVVATRPVVLAGPCGRVGRWLAVAGAAAWTVQVGAVLLGGVASWQPLALLLHAGLIALMGWRTPAWGLLTVALAALLHGAGAPLAQFSWVLVVLAALIALRPPEHGPLLARGLVVLAALTLVGCLFATPAWPPTAPAWLAAGAVLVISGLPGSWLLAGAGAALIAASAQVQLPVASSASWAALALALLLPSLRLGGRARALLVVGVAAASVWLCLQPSGAQLGVLLPVCLVVGGLQRPAPAALAPTTILEGAGVVLLVGASVLQLLHPTPGALPPAAGILTATALAWGIRRGELLVLCAPALAWLPGLIPGLDPWLVWPATLATFAVGTWSSRAMIPTGWWISTTCLALATAAAGGVHLVDPDWVRLAIHASLLAVAWGARRQAVVAVGHGWVAAQALLYSAADPSWGLLALSSLIAAVVSGNLVARGLSKALVGACAVQCAVALGVGDTFGGLGVLAVGWVVLLAWTVRGERPWRWYPTLTWGCWLFLAVRYLGPLQDLPPAWDLPLLVGLGAVLEIAHQGPWRGRGDGWVRPLRLASAALPLGGVVLCSVGGSLTVVGLTAAGALFCVRYVFRTRWEDLVIGASLLDVAAVLLAIRQGWVEPLAFVGPVALSVLLLAQVLRRSMDPRIVTALRYAAAGAVYLTTLAQVVLDPAHTLVLVVLGLVGMAAGSLLRVRAYLYLGTAFATSALVVNLVRFGLEHSRFWAFYLTGLGILVLAAMVVFTVQRSLVERLLGRFGDLVAEWE